MILISRVYSSCCVHCSSNRMKQSNLHYTRGIKVCLPTSGSATTFTNYAGLRLPAIKAIWKLLTCVKQADCSMMS